jgi:hypothetical protein
MSQAAIKTASKTDASALPQGEHEASSQLPLITGPRAPILSLQRMAGNQAVNKLLESGDRKQLVQSVLNSSGQPLDSSTRHFMESRFGYDFSRVMVHTDIRAAESARAVNASAYTVGQNIVFGAQAYAPHSADGKKRLAHELAHVVQQSSGPVTGVTSFDGLRISEPGDGFEQAAHNAANRLTTTSDSSPLPTQLHSIGFNEGGVIQRDGPEDQRYNLRIGSQTLQGATRDQVLNALRRHHRILTNLLESDQSRYEAQSALRDRQWIVGAIADFVADPLHGGIELPPANFLSVPRSMLQAVEAKLESGDIEASIRDLRRAEEYWRHANRLLENYVLGTISGAETSVTVLEVTAAAGAVAATVATGGAAASAGLGLLGTSAVAGGTAGAYGATQEYAGQLGEMAVGMRQSFDLAALLRRGATDAITGFVGAFVGGALSRYATRFFGSYLSNIGDDALRELGEQLGLNGPLPRDYFLTQGQRFIADFLGGAGTAPLTTAISSVINRLSGGGPLPGPEQFARQVIEEMVRGGAIQIFLGVLTHGHAVASRRAGAGGTPPETSPPARRGPSTNAPTETAGASGEVIPISQARRRVGPSTQLRPGQREVTSLETARQRRQATTRLRETPAPEIQSQAAPIVQAQPTDMRLAAGAERTSVSSAGPTPLRTVAMAGEPPGRRSASEPPPNSPTSQGSSPSSSHSTEASAPAPRSQSRSSSRRPTGGANRAQEVLATFAEEQGQASRTDLEADIAEHTREARTPGGRPVPESFEVGNFSHRYAERLIPESQLPRNLEAEHVIRLPEGGERRIDRLDRVNGVIYEIKPDTPYWRRMGTAQARLYAHYMNEFEPLSGGRQWQIEVVTYDRAAALRVMREIGWLER